MVNKKSATFLPRNGQMVPEGSQEIVIPDEAIYYIVSHYLQGRNQTEGIPAVIGISTQTVVDVLQLFVDWAAQGGYIKDGQLVLSAEEVE